MPYSRPYKRGDGKGVPTSLEEQFKQYGVKAIKAELARLGFMLSLDSPVFGWGTHWAVKQFQRIKGLTSDGVVGPGTLDALFRPRVEQIGDSFYVPIKILSAVVEKESSFDPGAYYFNEASVDRGIAMLNSSAYPDVADPDAFDVEQAIPLAVDRLAMAYNNRFRFRGQQLRRECTIASYNNPQGANDLFDGKPISEKLRGYIDDVLAIMTAAKIVRTTK